MATGRYAQRGRHVRLEGMEARGHLAAPSELAVTLPPTGNGLRVIKMLALLVVVVLGVASVAYLSLASTLMGAVPNWEEGNATWVKRSTFVGNVPDTGDIAMVSVDAPAATSVPGKFVDATAGISKSVIVVQVAGENGIITYGKDGEIFFNGNSTGYNAGQPHGEHRLERSNIGICLSGDCEPGSVLTYPTSHIVGEAEALVEPSGITPYDEAQ